MLDASGSNESEINKLKDENWKMGYQIKSKNSKIKKQKECMSNLNKDWRL